MVLHSTGSELDASAVQSAVRDAFRQLGTRRAAQPGQTVTDLPDGGDVIAYQAVLADQDVYAVKVSPYLPQPDGSAVVTAWTLLISTKTGQPLLLADSAELTAERTAATSALAVDLLAPVDAHRLAIVGFGPIGQAHLRHVRTVRAFDQITVFTPSLRDADIPSGVGIARSAQEAALGADVVMLCTSAAEPVIDVEQLPSATVVTSISTNAPLAHEIDPAALGNLDVYADYSPAAFAAAGEFRIAAEQGYTADMIRGDLAGLVLGTAPAPTGDRVTFFRSVGLGIEDAAVALVALQNQEQA